MASVPHHPYQFTPRKNRSHPREGTRLQAGFCHHFDTTVGAISCDDGQSTARYGGQRLYALQSHRNSSCDLVRVPAPSGVLRGTPSPLSSSFSLKKTKKEPAKVAHWVPSNFYSVRVLRLRFKGRL